MGRKTIGEAESYEAEAIQEAIFNLALELARIKKETEYWHELWDCDRDSDAQSLISGYDTILMIEGDKRHEAKEKEIVKEKGVFQGMVHFMVAGEIGKNFYRNDNIMQMKQDIENDLRSVGFYNPSLHQIGAYTPIARGRKKELENIKENEIMDNILSENIEYAVVTPVDDDKYNLKLIKEEE